MPAVLIDSMQRVGVGEGGEQDAHRVGRDVAAPRAGARSPVMPGIRWSLTTTATGSVAEQVEGRLGSLGPEHAVVHGEQRLERIEDARLVVHDEDGRLSRSRWAPRAMGRRSVNTAPPPAGLSARISPPCFLTIS